MVKGTSTSTLRRRRKPATRKPEPTASGAEARPPGGAGVVAKSLRIRMYRQGLGDCFLIRLPKEDGSYFKIMIDCGVVLGTENPEKKMRPVVESIIAETGGRVDLLVVTHEHWDHVSGFNQVADLFAQAGKAKPKQLSVGQVWMAWTENPSDVLANRLRKDRAERVSKLAAFVAAAPAMGLADDATVKGVDGILGFFGLAGGTGAGKSTAEAMDFARGLSSKVHYALPSDDPVELKEAPGYRFFALGPPHDEAALRKTDSTTEVYRELSDQGAAGSFFAAAMTNMVAAATGGPATDPDEVDRHRPFDGNFTRVLDPSSLAGRTPFFNQFYYGLSTDPFHPDQAWRRIDNDWASAAAEFALQLDSATNNTSLVLAIEIIDSGKVLLFAADAQVGNWLSWQNLSWKLSEDKTVTGPDLLKRTVFYKVGHHGSHNATLKAKGLELMRSDEFVAFIPVDHAMAVKKHWGKMPLPGLVDALQEKSKGRVVRVDAGYDLPEDENDAAKTFKDQLTSTDLFHEWEMPLG
jgi:hypothetical protein